MHTSNQGSFRADLLLMNHQHIHENIKLADQKATGLVVANGAILTLIYPLIGQSPAQFFLWSGLFVCLLTAAATGASFLVAYPRGDKASEVLYHGVIDPKRIALFKQRAYQDKVASIESEDLIRELSEFIHDRALIDKKKYAILRGAFRLSALSWILALLYAALVKLPNAHAWFS